jgi:hypothetical protein
LQLWAHTVQRSRVTRGASERRTAGRLGRRRRLALAVATSVLSIGAAAGPAVTPALAGSGNGRHYQFRTLNNSNDPTFNQLLGINNSGVIAGYFGSGAQGHPNKGYFLLRHYSQLDYRIENFPGSVQTQVTGLNNRGVTVGFWSDQNNANQVNDNFGFYAVGGRRFHTVNFPTTNPATPPVDQLLGVNNHNVAVGFYTDAARRQPRLRVQHQPTLVPSGHRFRCHQCHRGGDQQPQCRRRLLHQRRRSYRRVLAAVKRKDH